MLFYFSNVKRKKNLWGPIFLNSTATLPWEILKIMITAILKHKIYIPFRAQVIYTYTYSSITLDVFTNLKTII